MVLHRICWALLTRMAYSMLLSAMLLVKVHSGVSSLVAAVAARSVVLLIFPPRPGMARGSTWPLVMQPSMVRVAWAVYRLLTLSMVFLSGSNVYMMGMYLLLSRRCQGWWLLLREPMS